MAIIEVQKGVTMVCKYMWRNPKTGIYMAPCFAQGEATRDLEIDNKAEATFCIKDNHFNITSGRCEKKKHKR